ncbi:hypothetical protein SAMN05444143_1381 [Flavobacterium succinicans]|uniref:Uncharacterized protein n=1 Tax=Flavobacterium succinicans TaxID=29536 RepID=A0A1I5AET2_9FLAO|nr:hypothetical protein SAMN05444143_1381 [Flavobacterium succinicans]
MWLIKILNIKLTQIIMNKAMFLNVGSFVLSTIIKVIVPSGKAYRSINPKYFMYFIFISILTPFGILFFRLHNCNIPKNIPLPITPLINESLLSIIHFIMFSNTISHFFMLIKRCNYLSSFSLITTRILSQVDIVEISTFISEDDLIFTSIVPSAFTGIKP